MYPMGSSSRWWLNLDSSASPAYQGARQLKPTQVCNYTSSKRFDAWKRRKSMPEQLNQKTQGLTYLPEFNIVIFALLLNFPWEFLQVPFFEGMPTVEHWQGVKSCTQASIGDAVIMLVAFWCVAAFAGRYWLLRPKFAHIGSLVAVGVGITILIEKLAVSGGWVQSWSYSEQMLTAFGIGITPVLQWIVLPPLTIWFCKRQLV
jgi:hypothetical protein